jgi:hypothetical protein
MPFGSRMREAQRQQAGRPKHRPAREVVTTADSDGPSAVLRRDATRYRPKPTTADKNRLGSRLFKPNWATLTDGKPARPAARCHCGKPAHRLVGRLGFCGDHTADAYAAQSKVAASFAYALPDARAESPNEDDADVYITASSSANAKAKPS